jgi:hypothetical protein
LDSVISLAYGYFEILAMKIQIMENIKSLVVGAAIGLAKFDESVGREGILPFRKNKSLLVTFVGASD